jgi:hypothetical protein
MARITDQNLHAVAARINKLLGTPAETYTKVGDAYKANVGNYHLSFAYGGAALHRIDNDQGGTTDVLNIGHVKKGELYSAMFAFIAGVYAGRETPQ